MTGAETPNTTPENVSEKLDNKESIKVDIIKNWTPAEVNKAVEKHFPDAKKENEKLKNGIDISNTKEIDEKTKSWIEFQAALEEATQKLNADIDAIVNNKEQFKNIVTFMSYFQLPKNGSTIKIVNCPELQKNGNDKISDSSINDTNPEQKREIVKWFLSIPPVLVKEYIPGLNEHKPLHPLDMDSLANVAISYQQQQDKIALIMFQLEQKKTPSTDDLMKLANSDGTQKIGKLFELKKEDRTNITNQINILKTKYADYKINEITLKGEADATNVSESGKKSIAENFTNQLKLLNEKGFDTSNLPKDYQNFGQWLYDQKHIQQEDIGNIDIVSNRAFAFTRAMMQLSWVSKDQAQELLASNIKIDIKVNKEKWDDKTKWGIEFKGIGTDIGESGTGTFTIKVLPTAPEVIIENDVKFAVKIGNETKIFRFSKQDTISSKGEVKTINTFAKMTDEWSLWTHGNEKNTLDTMGDTKNKYSEADFGGPVFFINIPDAQQWSNPIIDKIKNSKNNQDTSVSVNELLSLYKSVGWSSTETAKIEKTYSVGNI